MHLEPARAAHLVPRAAARSPATLDLNGVTLPGAPLLVAGSNGHIAWGFTNSYGDWVGVQRIECSAVDERDMSTRQGLVPLSVQREEIRVHGAAAAVELVRSGPAGLLLRVDAAAHACWFGTWLALLPAATNLNLMALEAGHDGAAGARSRAADRHSGPERRHRGSRGAHRLDDLRRASPRTPARTRAAGTGGWTATADAPAHPRPASGRLWTANARVASDPRSCELIGGSHRQPRRRIRPRRARGSDPRRPAGLRRRQTPADMLHIQLDDRACSSPAGSDAVAQAAR